MAYAATTTVSVERTRGEIEKILKKFQCTQLATGVDHTANTAMVQFRARDRVIRFLIALPNPHDKQFTQESRRSWKRRAQSVIDAAVAQAERQRWRGLLLVIKAKLEAIESRIASFEEEFLAYTVMPNDQTVGQMMLPVVAEAYGTGTMPKQLTSGTGARE
jgi:hypothetical protein